MISSDPLAFVSAKILDRKSTRLNSSHANISYAVFCLKISRLRLSVRFRCCTRTPDGSCRLSQHTSDLQSRQSLLCCLMLVNAHVPQLYTTQSSDRHV